MAHLADLVANRDFSNRLKDIQFPFLWPSSNIMKALFQVRVMRSQSCEDGRGRTVVGRGENQPRDGRNPLAWFEGHNGPPRQKHNE